MRLIAFGDYVFPRVSAVDSLGTVEAPRDFILLPSDAFNPFGSHEAPDRPHRIIKQGELVYDTPAELQIGIDAARALRGTENKLWARTYNDEVRWLWAYCASVREERTSRNFNFQPLVYAFDVAKAHWNGHQHLDWLLDDGHFLDDGLYLDDDGYTETMASSPHTITVTNGGNRAVTNAVLTITAGSANITALTIEATSVQGDMQLEWAGVIAVGEALVIDCGAASVLNDGAADFQNFDLGAGHDIEEWLRIDPGDVGITVTFTGGSTDSTIDVAFADGWK